jgi:hypothetical protein
MALALLSTATSAPVFPTEVEPRYAVTESTMTGPKGSISLTQIALLGPPAAQAKCDGQLEADRNNRGAAVISSQRCLTQLPTHLAIAVDRKPLPTAYIFVVENSVLFFRAKSVHVVEYHFEPGPSSETCARWLARFKKFDPNAICIPPESKK